MRLSLIVGAVAGGAMATLVACGGSVDPGASSSSSGGSSSGGSTSSSSGGTTSGAPQRPPSSSSSSGVTSSSSSSSSSGSSGATTCNALTQLGSPMSVVAASGPAPVPQGGALADGTYVMTSATAYGTKNADGATLEAIGTATIAVSGSTLQVVLLDDKGKVEHQTYTITLSGSAMTTTQTCRDPGKLEAAQTGQFTATPTTLHTIIPAGGTSTYDIVYTRQ